MKKVLKKFFIPHADNNYHPHMLHTKRAFFYSAFFVSLKLVVFLFVLALPTRVFMLPDVLAVEQKKIIELTNAVRATVGKEPLTEMDRLDSSSQSKANDMAKYSYFSHVSPQNKTLTDWVRGAGYTYRYAGENLAMGFSTAADVVNVWVKSPTHYANLIDSDFVEIGVGMQAGSYADIPTVYVAEHFGQPIVPVTVRKDTPPITPIPQPKTVTVTPPEVVLAEKVVEAAPIEPQAPVYDRAKSYLFWQDQNDQTVLTARVIITGDVTAVTFSVGNYTVPLTETKKNTYTGTITVPMSSSAFFKVIIPAYIQITSFDGSNTVDQLNWYNVKTVSPTPLELYSRAKDTLSPLTSLFVVTRVIYIFGIILFSLALLLSIVIEFKKQHPHIILQTGGLLSLLILLMLV